MMLAIFPIYFSRKAEEQHEALCQKIDFFEDIWESVTFWLVKDPSHCGAVELENGLYVKEMPLHLLQGALWVAFTHNDACIRIHGICFKERNS